MMPQNSLHTCLLPRCVYLQFFPSETRTAWAFLPKKAPHPFMPNPFTMCVIVG